MEEVKLREFVEKGWTQRQIANEFGASLTNTQYWLAKYGLETTRTQRNNTSPDMRKRATCSICEKRLAPQSKLVCSTCSCKARRLRQKLKAIEYLGDCCSKCFKNFPVYAYDFHHPNDNKEFGISENVDLAWETLKEELDKCILLCKICHAGEHSDQERFRKLLEARGLLQNG